MIQRYKHPLQFYIFSTLIPWGFWLVAAYLSHRPEADSLGWLVSSLGLAGLSAPLLVAGYLINKDRQVFGDVIQRVLTVRPANRRYFVYALLLMPASILLAMATSLLLGYSTDQFIVTGRATFTSGVLPVWFLLVMAPVLEEAAWHSYGTDCLRQKFSLFTTSMIFALFWALWHVPLALIKGYYHSNLVAEGAIYSVNFLVSVFPFVILMNWFYYKTNRNIMVTIIIHLFANVFNEIFATHPDSKIIQTGLLTVLAIFVLIKDRAYFFTSDYTSRP